MEPEKIRETIRRRYADIALKNTGGCCGDSGCCGNDIHSIDEITANLGYQEDDIAKVPLDSNMGLGCGNPVALASIRRGETVLDLGSGGGLDCFLALDKVGDEGHVIGVDMTPEMIKLSRENARKAGYSNVEFRLGEIENLPVADETVDIIISNCVLNLSLDKQQVFREAYRVLKPGGRLCISDVVLTAKFIPEEIRDGLEIAGCIAGAEYKDNIADMLIKAGFHNVRMTPKDNSREIIDSWVPGKGIDDFAASFIIEAEK